MGHNHRRTCIAILLLVALVAAALAAAACSARATAGSSLTPSTSGTQGGPTDGASASAAGGAVATSGADLTRILKALSYMQADPPSKPIVVLLGGSAARESTISDASWRAQIVDKGGPATLAWNMGSRNRTMAQNVAIVKALPPAAKALVYIGINLGSFTSAQKTASITLPSPAPAAAPSRRQPHQYTVADVLPTARKKALVQSWLADRYPVYKRNFSTSAGVLQKLIELCKTRGYTPVLFELPRNTAVIGSALNAPTTKYRDKCKELAAGYDIAWISVVNAAKLPNSSFYDLWHLVEPGRVKWQGLLSANAARILTSDAFKNGGGS